MPCSCCSNKTIRVPAFLSQLEKHDEIISSGNRGRGTFEIDPKEPVKNEERQYLRTVHCVARLSFRKYDSAFLGKIVSKREEAEEYRE